MAKIHDNSTIFLQSSEYRFEPCHHYTSKLCLSLRNVTTAFLGLGHLSPWNLLNGRGVISEEFGTLKVAETHSLFFG